MSKKNDRNIVVLWDTWHFKDVADDIKNTIKDKNVVSYPPKHSKEDGTLNIKQFVEKSNHILVTRDLYFNGCECANVIFLTDWFKGIRNSILRGVQNILCIQVTDVGYEARMNGVKKDDRFYEKEN